MAESRPEFTAALTIHGDELDPDEISGLLGCQPNRSHRKGDKVSQRSSSLRKQGAWILDGPRASADDLATQIEAILDRVSEDADMWARINERFRTRLFCGVFLHNPEKLGEMFALPASLVQRIASVGLDLQFDVWPPTTDDE